MPPYRPSRPGLALVASFLMAGCSSGEIGTVGGPEKSAGPQADPSVPLVKGGKEQPSVKVKGKTVSAREAAGIGR